MIDRHLKRRGPAYPRSRIQALGFPEEKLGFASWEKFKGEGSLALAWGSGFGLGDRRRPREPRNRSTGTRCRRGAGKGKPGAGAGVPGTSPRACETHKSMSVW